MFAPTSQKVSGRKRSKSRANDRNSSFSLRSTNPKFRNKSTYTMEPVCFDLTGKVKGTRDNQRNRFRNPLFRLARKCLLSRKCGMSSSAICHRAFQRGKPSICSRYCKRKWFMIAPSADRVKIFGLRKQWSTAGFRGLFPVTQSVEYSKRISPSV